ncbi:MAG: hypothetical protein ACXVJ7_07855 [Acidimicrobiia bacterium]
MDQAHALTLPAARTSHEGLIARHLARHALLVAPVVVLLAGLVRGIDGGISGAIGLVLVAANFLAAAAILAWAATRGAGALYAAILGGFLLRLAVLVGIVLALEPVAFIDVPVLVLTVGIAHFALLAWETRYVSLTLAAPGLKPGVGEPSKDKE